MSRFQALVGMDALTKQSSNALERLHFWSKIQAEISDRRLSATEGQIKQMKFEDRLKVESKLHELEVLTYVPLILDLALEFRINCLFEPLYLNFSL